MSEKKDCIVCQKHSGKISLPGGIIFENDLIAITHAHLLDEETQHYLGHLFVETKRHVAELGDLTEAEAREAGLQVCRAAQALKRVLGVEHVYAFYIGDGVPHVHIHVIGRYPGAPREYWGAKVDEWPDAPKGDEKAIAALAEQVHAWLEANPA
ncbi:MAG: HIT family protein [Anaerolineaceae bacterium]|nr:HIT family protein [Anaerolineaceae bacterium]MBN2677505.1 HIT family protein [Anaerolineaceae bacterium]